MPSKLKIITKKSEVEELIHYCQTTKYCSLDYETTGLEYYSPHQYPLILGVSFQPGSSWILPLQHKDSPFLKTWEKHFNKFGKEVLMNPDIVKVAWNLKFEYKWSMRYDILLKGRLFDAMLAKYCLDEERPHDLKSFVTNFFPMYAGYEKKIRHNEDGDDIKVDWKNTQFENLCAYCGLDSDLTLRGMVYMEPKLMKLKFYNLFRNMLMGISRVLAESEYRGMRVDRKYLQGLIEQYKVKITESDKSMRQSREVVKFERKQKQEQIQKLINNVRLDIAKIAADNKPNSALLIRNREVKIKRFMEGQFSAKETYDGLNFKSPPQLIQFLYTKKGLNLPIIDYTVNKKTKQESDNPSTAEETLLKLQKKDKTGFIEKLLAHRGLTKLDSTYISGMYPNLDMYDRVHANFKVHGTVTGRLSCVQPNLQNIPRGSTAADIKRMFIPPPGYVLLEVDYSQAELRIIAELSEDESMIDIFRKNYNPHVATACKMEAQSRGIPPNKGLEMYDKAKAIIKKADMMEAEELARKENKEFLYWTKWKKKGKSMNFSVVYQQGPDATAEQLGCTKEEAKQFQKDWYAQFPGVKKWIDDVKRKAHRDEYVYNMFGGKRRLWNINSDNFGIASEAERQAVNAPVQGASGYFTLFAQVIIRELQMMGKLPKDMTHVYTVHDSIGIYIKPKDIHKVVPQLVEICNNPETKKYFGFELKHVRMKVSAEAGLHWAALKDYEPTVDYRQLLKVK